MSESQTLSFDQLIGAPVMALIIDQFTRLETMAILTILIIYFLLVITSRFSLQDKDGNKIPSGPLGLPILGSFPFLTHYPELKLHHWAKKFGGLYSLYLGNQLFVVVSDPVIAKDLMVTNGAIFSSRMEIFMKCQTIFTGRGITATPYNQIWRKHRRIGLGWLHQGAVDSYTDIMDHEAKVLVKELWKESKGGKMPVNPAPHTGRCALNNMLKIVFGFRTDRIDHPFIQTALKITREFANTTGPMSNLVDFIPLLQKFNSPLVVRGKKLHNDLVGTYGGFVKDIEQKMASGVEVPDCLAKSMLMVREAEELDELDVALLAGAFMIGGVETTAAVMQWFSALIPAYPHIQKKAHEELDRVVGRERLPTIEDEANLPYCRAIIKEVGRCYNPLWLGTPHTSVEDFTYKGKFIPKNTVVVLNTWTIHHDERRFENPYDFDPERYIQDSLSSNNSAKLNDANQRDHWMFGAGRRICPGIITAERELWLVISRMLWAFEMTEVPGQEIDLKEYDGKSGRSPMPFHINILPRDANIKKILEDLKD